MVHVAREDRRRQPVAGLVEGQHRGVVAVDRDDREHRSEDLLLADPVHRRDAGEDRRLEEVAVLEVAGRRPAAAHDELPFPAPDVDVRGDLVDRAAVDERPDIDGLVEPGAEPELAGPRLEALEQRLDDRAIDDHPRARRAALAGRPERRPQDPVRREVEVRVGQDDDPVLAAELHRQPLQPARRP